MVTEDLALPDNGGWLVVPLTSSQTIVHNSSGVSVFIRTGALSNSIGISLRPDEKVIVDETIYIRATSTTGAVPKVVVMR